MYVGDIEIGFKSNSLKIEDDLKVYNKMLVLLCDVETDFNSFKHIYKSCHIVIDLNSLLKFFLGFTPKGSP